MRSSIGRLVVSTLFLTLTAGRLQASGGSPAPTPTPARTPQDEAAQIYNAGLSEQDQARQLEKKIAKAETPEQKAKLQKRHDEALERSQQLFIQATRRDPTLHQAWSGLGYTLRKQGQYEAALDAYGKALALQPNYMEAIEYRGEAYLGLNRLDDAKSAYVTLLAKDRKNAGELLAAMKEWVDLRKADPQGVDAKTIDDFAGWVHTTEESAGSAKGERSW
ncbi:MAG TPA: tetratricopeptide repeat protein [Candidatus Polarisedimenticolaceae bacterium]|nr:tetratricopeptide repeat protein [Candidatus Polarisedimenticolaceae bacterium]